MSVFWLRVAMVGGAALFLVACEEELSVVEKKEESETLVMLEARERKIQELKIGLEEVRAEVIAADARTRELLDVVRHRLPKGEEKRDEAADLREETRDALAEWERFEIELMKGFQDAVLKNKELMDMLAVHDPLPADFIERLVDSHVELQKENVGLEEKLGKAVEQGKGLARALQAIDPILEGDETAEDFIVAIRTLQEKVAELEAENAKLLRRLKEGE